MVAFAHVNRLVTRWNKELKDGKFDGRIQFRETKRIEECAAKKRDGTTSAALSSPAGVTPPADVIAPSPSASEPEPAAEPEGPKDDELYFEIKNEDASSVDVRLYSQRDTGWDVGTIPAYDSASGKYACRPYEKICYGAWRSRNEWVTWGAGQGKEGCQNCCFQCGSRQSITLNAGHDASNEASFKIRSLDRHIVELAFFTSDARYKWPAGDKIYQLKDSEYHEFVLNCSFGQKICFGASKGRNYWGAGPTGREGCENCCTTCGGRQFVTTLDDSGSGSAVAGGSGDASAGQAIVRGLIDGLAIGGAIGGALNRGGGGAAPAYAPTPRPAPRQSDISGTRR